MLLTIFARKHHDVIIMKTSSLEHKDPDVFWLRVRFLVEVEFVVFSLSFEICHRHETPFQLSFQTSLEKNGILL